MTIGWDALDQVGGYLQVGDVVFQRSDSDVSRVIRLGSTHRGENPTFASHVAMILFTPLSDPALPGAARTGYEIIEATTPVSVVAPLYKYRNDSSDVVIFRVRDLGAGARWDLQQAAVRYLKKRYPLGKIVLHGLDWLLGGRYLFRRLGHLEPSLYCNDLVAAIYADADIPISTEQHNESTPDGMLDYFHRHPERYSMIFASSERALGRYREAYPEKR